MAALLDVNVLVPLVSGSHRHTSAAHSWFAEAPKAHCVVCRVAQLGWLRLSNNPSLLGEKALSSEDCWSTWHELVADARIRFTSAEPPGLDSALQTFTRARRYHHKLWTDAYLAAFASAAGLTMVTFDKGFRQFDGLELDLLT